MNGLQVRYGRDCPRPSHAEDYFFNLCYGLLRRVLICRYPSRRLACCPQYLPQVKGIYLYDYSIYLIGQFRFPGLPLLTVPVDLFKVLAKPVVRAYWQTNSLKGVQAVHLAVDCNAFVVSYGVCNEFKASLCTLHRILRRHYNQQTDG